MAEEVKEQRSDKRVEVEAKHVHRFDALIDNPIDPPTRELCACGAIQAPPKGDWKTA